MRVIIALFLLFALLGGCNKPRPGGRWADDASAKINVETEHLYLP